MKSRKLTRTGEISYVLATVLTCLGVSLMTKADFGLSMIVAPAYILSQKVTFLSFGTAEYVVQALLLIALFIALRRFEWRFMLTFVSAVIYGAVLDGIILLTDAYTVPDSIVIRIVCYAAGLLISDAGVALYFNSYLPPCCYDMFVRELANGLKLNFNKVKITYDVASFAVVVIMSLVFFGGIRGIGVGTVVCVILNGLLIRMFNAIFSKITDFSPAIPKLYDLIGTDK